MDLKHFIPSNNKIFDNCNMDLMFEAYLTHESNSQLEPDDIPQTKDPVWILGRKYNSLKELEEIRKDIRSRLWFSYRKGFVPIGDSGITSDKGWGCMLRCGQMIIAQALLFLHLGRDWRWSPLTRDKVYLKILRMFEDLKSVPYSIHQIAVTGASEGKQVGEWFGPNTVAQVLKKLTAFDEWNSITLHIALDNVLVTNEVKRLCRQPRNENNFRKDTKSGFQWKPLVLIIPLRLGITDINPIYLHAFKVCFTFEQSLGIIGGKPNHALYFIGCVGNDVIFLDPHTTQSSGLINNKETEQERKIDNSYHCQYASRLHILQMDPSVAICFLCREESEFDSLCKLIKEKLLSTQKLPLFEICEERSCDWRSGQSNSETSNSDFAYSYNFVDVSKHLQADNSDDDFEFLG